jgi:hypothetical protein
MREGRVSIPAAKFAESERKYENMTWFLNTMEAKFKIHYTSYIELKG